MDLGWTDEAIGTAQKIRAATTAAPSGNVVATFPWSLTENPSPCSVR